MLKAISRNGPLLGGMKVVGFEDLRDEHGRMGPFKGETDKAARNFLIFRLGGNGIHGKVCLRPSGTEPKLKVYLQSRTDEALLDRLEAEARKLLGL